MTRLLPILALALWGFWRWLRSETRLRMELAAAPRLPDPELEKLVAALGHAAGVTPQLHALPWSEVNALAAKNGRVFLTEGALARRRHGEIGAEQLAGMIAHELGHLALGHAERRIKQAALQGVLRTVLGLGLRRFVPFAGPFLADRIAIWISAQGMAPQEFKADAFAADLMTRAGLAPEVYAGLLSQLDAEIPRRGRAAWILGHPSAKRRLEAMGIVAR